MFERGVDELDPFPPSVDETPSVQQPKKQILIPPPSRPLLPADPRETSLIRPDVEVAGTCAARGGSTLGKEPLEVSAIFFVITCETVSLTGLPSSSRTAFPSASNLSCSTLIVRCVMASVFTPFCVTKSVTENVSPASSVTSSPTETLYKITSPDSRVTPC